MPIKLSSFVPIKKIEGILAAHTIPNLFYILRKTMDINMRKQVILDLCNIFNIEPINREKILSAIQNRNFDDFEDCLQMECAISCGFTKWHAAQWEGSKAQGNLYSS